MFLEKDKKLSRKSRVTNVKKKKKSYGLATSQFINQKFELKKMLEGKKMNPFDINPVFSEEEPLCNMCPFREPANEIQVMFRS